MIQPHSSSLHPLHPADAPQYAQPAFRGGKLAEESADKKQSNHVKRILDERKKDAKIDPILEQQFKAGRLLAIITSRPGQSGRADGYILEGKELDVSPVPRGATTRLCSEHSTRALKSGPFGSSRVFVNTR